METIKQRDLENTYIDVKKLIKQLDITIEYLFNEIFGYYSLFDRILYPSRRYLEYPETYKEFITYLYFYKNKAGNIEVQSSKDKDVIYKKFNEVDITDKLIEFFKIEEDRRKEKW